MDKKKEYFRFNEENYLYNKTILLAWELGEGLGHLPALKAIALAAKAEGAKPVFALRDTMLTRAALAEIEAPVLAAPFWPTPALPKDASGSYADILAGNGFGSAANARAMITAWDQLFDTVKPDLIVCEHAPGAGARGVRAHSGRIRGQRIRGAARRCRRVPAV